MRKCKDSYRANFTTTNSNTGRTPLMSFFCYFWGMFRVCRQIMSSLSQSLTTTFTSRRTTRRFETSADTVRHSLFAITETFCHYWVSSRFVRWMYSTRMFWWYISPVILRRLVSCQFLSSRWNNVVREFTPPYVSIHISLLVSTIQCWHSPSSVGIHRGQSQQWV